MGDDMKIQKRLEQNQYKVALEIFKQGFKVFEEIKPLAKNTHEALVKSDYCKANKLSNRYIRRFLYTYASKIRYYEAIRKLKKRYSLDGVEVDSINRKEQEFARECLRKYLQLDKKSKKNANGSKNSSRLKTTTKSNVEVKKTSKPKRPIKESGQFGRPILSLKSKQQQDSKSA